MSLTIPSANPLAFGLQACPGYFDDDFINIPQAQDSIVYAYRSTLEEELGLVNPYDTWLGVLSEQPQTSNQEDHTEKDTDRCRDATPDSATGSAAVTFMDTLDNGSGRVRGSPTHLAKHRSERRRLVSCSPCRANCSTTPPLTPMGRYSSTPPGTPRTVYEPAPLSRPPSPGSTRQSAGKQRADGLNWPWYQCIMDGIQPTDTFIEYTGPTLQDWSSWELNYPVKDIQTISEDGVSPRINRETTTESYTAKA